MSQILEENEGEIPERLAGWFTVEYSEAERARKKEERRQARAAGGVEDEDSSEYESETESDSDSSEEEEEEQQQQQQQVVPVAMPLRAGSLRGGGGRAGEGKGQRRRRAARVPSSSGTSSYYAAAATMERVIGGGGGGGGGVVGAVGSFDGEGALQTVVVQPHGGGQRHAAGSKGMVGVVYYKNRKKWYARGFQRSKKNLMIEPVGDIKEGATRFDGLARLIVGIMATCNYTIDGEFHLGPYSGVYAVRKHMLQGKPNSNHNIPSKDREYIQMGIFNDEQRQRYELTGEVIPWCYTAVGKLILKDEAAKEQLEAHLRKHGRVGAAYGAMGVAAASSSSSSSSSEEEEKEAAGEEEGEMMMAAAAVAAQAGGRDDEEDDEDEWEEEGEGGGGSSDSDSSGEWETYHVSFPALPPTAAAGLLSSSGGGGGLAASSLAQQQQQQQGVDDDAGSESSWEPLRR